MTIFGVLGGGMLLSNAVFLVHYTMNRFSVFNAHESFPV